MIESVSRLAALGLHIIPMRDGDGGKRPAVQWRRGGCDYVQTAPTPRDLSRWANMPGTAGWAIVCGGPSRVVCVDVEAAGMARADVREAMSAFNPGCLRRSPSGGLHAWVRVTEGTPPATQRLAVDADGVLLAEIRGEGAYAVALGYGRGDLPIDWRPQEMAREEFDRLAAPIRVLDAGDPERPEAAQKRSGRPVATGTHPVADALLESVREDPESILCLLDDGWDVGGWDYGGRMTLIRPDYGAPPKSFTSANLRDGILIVWSTSVPWAPFDSSGKPKPMDPLGVVARARFGGDFREAVRAVEAEARR